MNTGGPVGERTFRAQVALATIVTVALLLAYALVASRFGGGDFMPHRFCLQLNAGLIWLTVTSDLLIGFSYVAISLTLVFLVMRTRREIPFHWVFFAFGAFIVACGATHFMDVLTVWRPWYWLAGNIKLVTAIASVATAIATPPLVPRVVKMVQAAREAEESKRRLEEAHAELQGLYARVTEVDRLKTEFFANVSHELRTPLTLLLGPLERLLSGGELGIRERHLAEIAQRNARVLLNEVNQLLDFARLEAGRLVISPVDVDVAEQLRVAVANHEFEIEDRQLDVRVEAPAALIARVDRERMSTVINNLLTNAMKFTPDGGVIRAEVSATGANLRLVVSDSGRGVPRELREKVWDRFEQGTEDDRSRGTGIGLALVREIVQLHGGDVSLSDADLGGAEFRIELPGRALAAREGISPSASAHRPAGSEQVAASPSDATVLVVEDNAELSRFLRSSLEDLARIEIARDGAEGLERARAEAPDVIITDVMMPTMSGDRMAEELKQSEATRDIPIIFLTARGDEALRLRMLSHGAHDYLAKPVSVEELRARVRNALEMRRARVVLQRALETTRTDLASLSTEVVERRQEALQALDAAKSASRAKDEFIATLSHELRTPLTAILGWIRVLRMDQGLSEQARNALDTIERGARSLERIIEDILDLSRMATGRFRISLSPVDVRHIAEESLKIVEPAAAAKGIELSLHVSATPLIAQVDAERLQQVLWNLLSNSIKFSPSARKVELSASGSAEGVVLQVRDEGEGIRPELLPHIFEPFLQGDASFTRAHSGLGLGLAIVRRIVELHGGSVDATSEGVGKGATFVVRLPAAPARHEAARVRPPAELSGSLVLLVDDDDESLAMLSATLGHFGAEVMTARSVDEALKVAANAHCIVTDVGMPGRSGFELARIVRSDSRSIPLIALTAYSALPADSAPLFDRILQKPVEPAELAWAIEELVSDGRGGTPGV